jgi:hydroxymethylpyrimidine/phosphomethylpyrimidine kinase
MRTALTIGSSDSSGGAGVQADLKVFTVLGVYGASAVTAVVARNTQGVAAAQAVDAKLVVRQIDAVAEDVPPDAFKTGRLGTAAVVGAVADAIQRHGLDRYVCDPELVGDDGQADTAAVHACRPELLPLATVVTANRAEAALLANMAEGDVGLIGGAKKAAEKIVRAGARAVVVKGLLTGNGVTDLFFDGEGFVEFGAKRLTARHTYGAGDLFSAVITAMLAQEIELPTAVDHARSMVSQAIEHHVKLGGGVRPVNVLALTP